MILCQIDILEKGKDKLSEKHKSRLLEIENRLNEQENSHHVYVDQLKQRVRELEL